MIVITGDDLGLSSANNAGILTAFRHGVLTTTSLMIAGDAIEEAIEIARQHRSLAVGLHVTFADTKPVLPPEQVSMLVLSDGRFPPDDHAHRRALLSIKGRRQIRAEMAAQFQAFHATGIPFDHVNSHRHVHRHPLLAYMFFREAARWPVKMTRIPFDPPTDPARLARDRYLRFFCAWFGLRAPDCSIGRDWNAERLVTVLSSLPRGTTELYFHPVTAADHMFAADLPTLLDETVKATLARMTVSRGLRDL